ncbi:hypothetical protein HBI56_047030 [Parastagonospora nodorum]|nr:hypothetical protein HBH53_018550 [Parastagonospora nodorum]KAH3965473.1 hypothetical protein HBH51_152620 [Parastagonospora nodorum]KAH3977273.1 hypothetical protein HBH52_112950 [Parastagonospora nodorum]KAH3999960.1 hypothetical protein HBI10_108790 [Parastagonospora nodorum]KAH4022268.1 hypothetical protein HBI13_100380 [Parastagonospora nodorum]
MVKNGGYTVSGAATKMHFSDGFRGLRSAQQGSPSLLAYDKSTEWSCSMVLKAHRHVPRLSMERPPIATANCALLPLLLGSTLSGCTSLAGNRPRNKTLEDLLFEIFQHMCTVGCRTPLLFPVVHASHQHCYFWAGSAARGAADDSPFDRRDLPPDKMSEMD